MHTPPISGETIVTNVREVFFGKRHIVDDETSALEQINMLLIGVNPFVVNNDLQKVINDKAILLSAVIPRQRSKYCRLRKTCKSKRLALGRCSDG